MKAQNLTISIPYEGCDKNCPYCIAQITGIPKPTCPNPLARMQLKTEKVRRVCKAAQISSVLLTGKGEPFLNPGALSYFLKIFGMEWPIEVQTNGLRLSQWLMNQWDNMLANHTGKDPKDFAEDVLRQIDILALSVDYKTDYPVFFDGIFKACRETGTLVRVCHNITDHCDLSIEDIVNQGKELGVHQILIRNITTPKNEKRYKDFQAREKIVWVKDNTKKAQYNRLWEEFQQLDSRLVRVLPHGAAVWDVAGIGVSFSDYCIQEINNTEDIRSLIWLEDSHVYTSWNSKASVLF